KIEHRRQIAGNGDARRLRSGGIEKLVAGIERRREDAVNHPFELLLVAVVALDDAAALAGQNAESRLEQMLLWQDLAPRRDFQHEDRHGISAAADMYDGAVDAEMRPGFQRDSQHVDAKTFIDRHAFPGAPV